VLRRLEAILSLAVLGMPPDARKKIRGHRHAQVVDFEGFVLADLAICASAGSRERERENGSGTPKSSLAAGGEVRKKK
jgi:hypothetical protein